MQDFKSSHDEQFTSKKKKQVVTAIACLNLQKDQRPLCLLLHAPGIGFRLCQHK